MPRLSFITGARKPSRILRTGTFRKPRRLESQDYQTLLDRCLKTKQLFVDSAFPAELSSIGCGNLLRKLPPCVEWKRPQELVKNPQFFAEDASRFDLHQGLTENCWFLAALASVTFHKDLLTNIVPCNQSFDMNYAGIFHFRFWRFGEWVDVVVDDRLPVDKDGKLLFVSSTRKNLFWGALLEKAYAKLCGSYEDLQIGQVSEALVDFTGGVNMTIKLDRPHPDLWQTMLRAAYSGSLMGCQTNSGPERVLQNGLVAGHAYTVTGIRQVTCKSGTENLVRLRNPWGKIEWKGNWSDSSSKWDQLGLKERLLLRKTREDGEFWMSVEDFEAHFVELVICKLTPDLLSHEKGKKWTLSMQTGKWVAGDTAGGRLTFTESYWKNPQYRLKILKVENIDKRTNSCNVLVSLLQKQNHKHRNQSPPLYIGMSVFKVPLEYQGVGSKLPQAFFINNRPVNNKCVFINEREVTQDYHLLPGSYVIVPSTAEPDEECEFILRVFSRKHLLEEQGKNPNILCCKKIADKQDDLEIWRYFEKHPEISVSQLQMLLNKGMWTSMRVTPVKFSLDACKVIMAQLDVNASGTLNMIEFNGLWQRVISYQEIFQRRDIDKSGYLKLNDLQAAVQEKGITLSPQFYSLLGLRYGNSSLKINFENFVCLMLRMEINGEVFKNLSQDGKGIYLNEAEVGAPYTVLNEGAYSQPALAARHTAQGPILPVTGSPCNMVTLQWMMMTLYS